MKIVCAKVINEIRSSTCDKEVKEKFANVEGFVWQYKEKLDKLPPNKDNNNTCDSIMLMLDELYLNSLTSMLKWEYGTSQQHTLPSSKRAKLPSSTSCGAHLFQNPKFKGFLIDCIKRIGSMSDAEHISTNDGTYPNSWKGLSWAFSRTIKHLLRHFSDKIIDILVEEDELWRFMESHFRSMVCSPSRCHGLGATLKKWLSMWQCLISSLHAANEKLSCTEDVDKILCSTSLIVKALVPQINDNTALELLTCDIPFEAMACASHVTRRTILLSLSCIQLLLSLSPQPSTLDLLNEFSGILSELDLDTLMRGFVDDDDEMVQLCLTCLKLSKLETPLGKKYLQSPLFDPVFMFKWLLKETGALNEENNTHNTHTTYNNSNNDDADDNGVQNDVDDEGSGSGKFAVLLDWIICGNTRFLEYLVEFLRHCSLQQEGVIPPIVLKTLVELRHRLQTLHDKQLLSFSPLPLFRRIDSIIDFPIF
eukprot:m.112137 g.112137  ORF g.112137 m.112137 type:complete len:479 (+) comp9248_c1_seq1:5952-7388(+)